ncbi:MAG: hypothetical protein ACREVY_05100 [Gammaproteobacteria bacterium]
MLAEHVFGAVSHVPSDRRPEPAASEVLRVGYVESEGVQTLLQGRFPLARIDFGDVRPPETTSPWPLVRLKLPQLQAAPLAEVWTSGLPVQYFHHEGLWLAANKEILFGYFEEQESAGSTLAGLVHAAYRRILTNVRASGYPHLLRVWNYLPGITELSDGLERYQQFCIGRYQALVEERVEFQNSLPAATAVGTGPGPVHIYFLASRREGVQIENPRQVNAYHYPRRYGPKSPSFARASLLPSESGNRLFIAGTASIVGHASRHAGDPYRQTVETLDNIEAVIAAALVAHPVWHGIGNLTSKAALLKVYVRRPEHLPAIERALADRLGSVPRCLFLRGDLCRSALLLEIEGIVSLVNAEPVCPGER